MAGVLEFWCISPGEVEVPEYAQSVVDGTVALVDDLLGQAGLMHRCPV